MAIMWVLVISIVLAAWIIIAKKNSDLDQSEQNRNIAWNEVSRLENELVIANSLKPMTRDRVIEIIKQVERYLAFNHKITFTLKPEDFVNDICRANDISIPKPK